MYDYKEFWKEKISCIINELLDDAGIKEKITIDQVIAENPPDPKMGDIGFPMFGYAKLLRKAPAEIAKITAEKISKTLCENTDDKIEAQGPYVNVRLDRAKEAKKILDSIFNDNEKDDLTFRKINYFNDKKIMIEFSSPNTNKPLHLGHLRNNVLGESISRILAARGANVRKVCIINDRGIHICKSMLAYKEYGQDKTPESENIKSDRFVGDFYIVFNNELKKEIDKLIEDGADPKEAEASSSLMIKAKELLLKWESGDKDTTELWKKMNKWAMDGMKKTYERTNISFDQYYYESETYKLGKEEALRGLKQGIFYKQDDGAVAVDLTDEKLDKKILLRSDGTSIYITQDLGTAINRRKDWPFEQMIYVVGSEQQYHFKVLFILLEKLKFTWAKNLFHLSYGMVNLPEGKMKSREGTVVDADDLIDSLRDTALDEIRQKEREEDVKNPEDTAEKIALGALHYFLLGTNPVKDMLFDPKESLSFTGNTGPYLQYMGARICSMLKKYKQSRGLSGGITAGNYFLHNGGGHFSLLTSDPEWELIKALSIFPEAVTEAAANLDPSHLTGYLYELAKSFNRFYHECSILNNENEFLSEARMGLSCIVLLVLKEAFNLVCIPFLEVM